MAAASDNKLLLIPAMVAATAVVTLTIAQSDQFSRRFLKSDKVQTKRLVEYKYRWDQSLQKALLRAQMYLAGGINAHAEQQEQQSSSSVMNPSTIWDESGLTALIQEWMQQDKQQSKPSQSNGNGNITKTSTTTPFPQILGLVREGQQEEHGGGGGEILIELYHPQSGNYQLPFQRFGLLLADMMESTVTTTTMCFVADASSGLASQFVADLLESSRAGVAIIREPIWMTSFASLVGERVISQDKMQKILFGLIRMEALRVKDQIGDARTVLFTLPGQAITSIMLPLLQGAFPSDRHVFGYQSCIESIERAMALRILYKRATVPKSLEEAMSYAAGPSTGAMATCCTDADPTRFTTPMRSSITKSVFGLAEALAALRLYHADTTEAWMSSVDAFFKLKEEEATNGYLPYTLKLSLLLGDPDGSLEEDSDRYNSLRSLLQFVTGCKSRPLPEGVLDASKEWLRDYANQLRLEVQNYSKLTHPECKAVENCAFKHKSILIQDKTLKDTVLPSKHWSLKQATKKGCSCCAPEDDLDEEEEAMTTRLTMQGNGTKFAFDPTKFSKTATPLPTTSSPSPPKYVDGKTTFAFDPTKFS